MRQRYCLTVGFCLNLDLGGFKGLMRLAANTFTADTQRKAVNPINQNNPPKSRFRQFRLKTYPDPRHEISSPCIESGQIKIVCIEDIFKIQEQDIFFKKRYSLYKSTVWYAFNSMGVSIKRGSNLFPMNLPLRRR